MQCNKCHEIGHQEHECAQLERKNDKEKELDSKGKPTTNVIETIDINNVKIK